MKKEGRALPVWKADETFHIPVYPVEVCSDVHVVFYDRVGAKKKAKMLEFWLHTSFLDSNMQIVFKKVRTVSFASPFLDTFS